MKRFSRLGRPLGVVLFSALVALAGAAEDQQSLRRDTSEVLALAQAARTAVGSDAELEQQMSNFERASREIDEQDYSLRTAADKTDRLLRDFEAKQRELERVKQHYTELADRLRSRGAQIKAAVEDLSRRYPNKELPEPQYSEWEREWRVLAAREDQLNKDSAQHDAEANRAWEKVFQEMSAVQREVREAAARRDQLQQAKAALMNRRAAARSALGNRLSALQKRASSVAQGASSTGGQRPSVTPSAPPPSRGSPAPGGANSGGQVPLTPFEAAPAQRPAGLTPITERIPQRSGSAIEQAGGALDASRSAAARQNLDTVRHESSLRTDTSEGPRGEVNLAARGLVAPVQNPAVARIPAVNAMVQKQQIIADKLEAAKQRRAQIFADPGKFPPRAMGDAVQEINDLISQQQWVYFERLAAEQGSRAEPAPVTPPAAPSPAPAEEPRRFIFIDDSTPEPGLGVEEDSPR